MISLLVSIIALGIIITIHEFGHFLAARAMGIGVIEFSIGMGPRICSKVIGNVRYSLRIMPFGGSCMMLGEELDESEYMEDEDDCVEADRECGSSDDAGNVALSESESYKKEEISSLKAAQFNNGSLDSFERSEEDDCFIVDGRRYSKDSQFISKPAWRRFIVIAAGPVFNFVLAFLLSAIICGCYGFDRPTVIEVQAGGPVAEAGIEPGDEIYAQIDNPVLDDGSSCVVIKESFGDAFIPFLVDHYQHIYIVDYRYFYKYPEYNNSVYELVKDKNVQDVIFINNVSAMTTEKSAALMSELFD